MKLIANLLERAKPMFEDGGKLARLHPVFKAADHIFFAASERAEHAPHGREALDVKRYMSLVILGLLPCLAAAVYFFGLRVFAILAVSYIAGGLVEVLFAVVRKEEINEGFLVTGLIFPLILPPALPLWMVGMGSAFGVLVGKEVFGGTGRNPFNPALVGRCFLAIGYPAAMSANYVIPGEGIYGRLLQYVGPAQVDAICTATPLSQAKAGLHVSFSSLFFGNVSGSAGETSALAILLGGVILMLTRVVNWRTVVAVLASYAGLGGMLRAAAPGVFGPTGWHMLAGGLLFGAFFMATDPVSGPVTNGAKWMYGILIGMVTLLIRNMTGYVEGVTFAILLGNIAAPSLDEIVLRWHARRIRNEGLR